MKVMISALAIGLSVALAAGAQAEDLKPVKLAMGISTVNIGYPNATLPLTLGYWKEEGLDVELLTTGGTLQGIQQLVGGGAQFAEGNVAGFLQGIAQNDLPLRVLVTHGVVDWKFVVPVDSAIHDAKTLEGKRLGMVSLASGGLPLLKSYLSANGVAPDSVEVIPVGFGAAPVEALRKGEVDALLYWASAVAAFENAGLKMKTFAPEEWPRQPDYVLATTEDMAKKDPEMVIGMSRGMMKAVLFTVTNPECALKLHWDKYPDTRSQGADEAEAKARDLNILKAKIESYEAAAKLSETEGKADQPYWDGLLSYMVEAGLIPAKIPTGDFLVAIPDFFKKVNDYDHAAVVAQAKACAF